MITAILFLAVGLAGLCIGAAAVLWFKRGNGSGIVDWIKGTFGGDNAQSWGRVGSAVALLCSCVWNSILVWRIKDVKDYAGSLPALTAFIVMGCLPFIIALYWISKAYDVKKAIGDAKNFIAGPGDQGGQAGFSRIGALLLIVAIMVSVSIVACGKSIPVSNVSDRPIENVASTPQGEPVKQEQPVADLKKEDVPADVKTKDVVIDWQTPLSNGDIHHDMTVKEKDSLFGKDKYKQLTYNTPGKKKPKGAAPNVPPAPVGLPTPHIPAPDHVFFYWTIGIILGLFAFAAALWALGKYVPFFGPLVSGLNKAAEPIAEKVGEVAGEVGASAIEAERGIVKRFIAWIKRLLSALMKKIKK